MAKPKHIKKNVPTPGKSFSTYLVEYITKRTLQSWLGLTAKLIAGWYLSHILQSLTRGALWFPEEWREIVTFISSLTFMATAELAGSLWLAYGRRRKKKTHERLWRALSCLCFLGMAMVAVARTNELRESSVWQFSPTPDFWDKRFDRIEGSTNRYQIPDILNKARGTLYFPSDIEDTNLIHDLRTYAMYQASLNGYSLNTNDLKACINLLINVDPDYIFDNLATSEPGMSARQRCNNKFMFFHFSTILCIAFAWGCFKREEEVAVETFINIFKKHD